MSQNVNSNTVGGFVEVLRQRYTLDHSASAKTFVNEEYTLISHHNDVSNIILEESNFLPNLIVFDSDGEELPVMPNVYTRALIESWIDDSNENEKNALQNLLERMNDQQIFLIWIKLPPNKQLEENQVKVITLEYNATKEERKSNDYTLTVFSPAEHSVFYTIKSPVDYEFKKQNISTTVSDKRIKANSWKKGKQDFMYVTKTADSLTITSKPHMINPVILNYSFRPAPHIISFPVAALVFLTLSAIYLGLLTDCLKPDCVLLPLSENELALLGKRVEIGISIIAASLVLPRLIKNDYVRHSMLILYFMPILLTVVSLFP